MRELGELKLLPLLEYDLLSFTTIGGKEGFILFEHFPIRERAELNLGEGQ